MNNKRIIKGVFFLLMTNLSLCQEFGITAFGTKKVTKEWIQANYQEKLIELRSLYEDDREQYHSMRAELAREFKRLSDFAYVNVTLFRSYTDKYDFIIDFVETADSLHRLNYRQLTTRTFEDPSELISKWEEYQEVGYELFQNGELSDWSCPTIHCLWSFNHPKLTSYLDFFDANVPKYSDLLVDILEESDAVNFRASAAFLLSHAAMKNADLLEALLPGITDPDSEVRNNSMRVMYYIVRAQSDIDVDIPLIINALNFPSFTDRNKALVILRSISFDGLHKEHAIRLSNILIEILEKKDAHNYKNAHQVLKNLSGQDYAIEDVKAWKTWSKSLQKGWSQE